MNTPKLPKIGTGDAPHKVVGRMAVDAIRSAEGIGATVAGVLDTPLRAVGAPEGPHHVVGNAIDLGLDTTKSVVGKVLGA